MIQPEKVKKVLQQMMFYLPETDWRRAKASCRQSGQSEEKFNINLIKRQRLGFISRFIKDLTAN